MASSQLLGNHGAWADWIGYGPSTQPIGGLVHLWDYPNEATAGGWAPAGRPRSFPITWLADCSRDRTGGCDSAPRTGKGGHASVAQAEAVVNILGDQMLKEGVDPGSVGPVAIGTNGVRPGVRIRARSRDSGSRLRFGTMRTGRS